MDPGDTGDTSRHGWGNGDSTEGQGMEGTMAGSRHGGPCGHIQTLAGGAPRPYLETRGGGSPWPYPDPRR